MDGSPDNLRRSTLTMWSTFSVCSMTKDFTLKHVCDELCVEYMKQRDLNLPFYYYTSSHDQFLREQGQVLMSLLYTTDCMRMHVARKAHTCTCRKLFTCVHACKAIGSQYGRKRLCYHVLRGFCTITMQLISTINL